MTSLVKEMLSAVEDDLKNRIELARTDRNSEMISLMRYHMGWEGAGSGASGKRLRPLFTLLAVQALSPNAPEMWEHALPAASAVELIHNFSLIHDDIEDNSDTRRGRTTIWKICGVPQAINTGDAMFAIAHQAVYGLLEHFPAITVTRVAQQLLATSIELTNGQHLDMGYETREDLTVEDYWPMISGKTAALLSACAKIGGILAGTDEVNIERMAEFGRELGLAFQVQDDILGIWGEEIKTGKSAGSDILTRKKSYPILLSLQKKGRFYNAWHQGPFQADHLSQLSEMVKQDGTYHETISKSNQLTNNALALLEDCGLHGDAGEMLSDLCHQLLEREV